MGVYRLTNKRDEQLHSFLKLTGEVQLSPQSTVHSLWGAHTLGITAPFSPTLYSFLIILP